MSVYQELKGLKVKFLDADTSGDRAIEGEVFYNSTAFTLAAHIAVGAWSAGTPTSTALGTTSGSGSKSAGIIFGGADTLANTEEYNGFGWSAGGNLNTGRYGAGEATAAPQTAALIFGGVVTSTRKSEVEEYNGSTWSEVTDMPADIGQLAGAGTQTAALSISGGPSIAESYEYDGTNWTAGGNINTARERSTGFGLQTAAVAVGGGSPIVANVEEYDGSSWTNATAYPTVINHASSAGTLTAGLVFGGSIPPTTTDTKFYDGTNWTATGALATARATSAGFGTSTSAVMAAGASGDGTALKNVEEWNLSILTTTWQ